MPDWEINPLNIENIEMSMYMMEITIQLNSMIIIALLVMMTGCS